MKYEHGRRDLERDANSSVRQVHAAGGVPENRRAKVNRGTLMQVPASRCPPAESTWPQVISWTNQRRPDLVSTLTSTPSLNHNSDSRHYNPTSPSTPSKTVPPVPLPSTAVTIPVTMAEYTLNLFDPAAEPPKPERGTITVSVEELTQTRNLVSRRTCRIAASLARG
jgi:hypothetical protein